MTVADHPHPLVSFVIPCYNYGRYLSHCLASIFGQQGREDFEIIAIDDASTDNTQEVFRLFADPRLKVIVHQTNLGHATTLQEGLTQARGRFIARIDPDDRYRPHFLSTVLGKLEAFPEVALVYGDAAMIDEKDRVTAEHCDRVHGGMDFKGNEFVRLLEQNFICSPTVIARCEAWREILPIPTHLAFHDWYLTLQVARKHDFYYVNQVLADYRVHSANHHIQVVRNKTEEASIFWLLGQIYCQKEEDEELESGKQSARNRVYGAQYLTLADKYFGLGMIADARRCYRRAIRHRPHWIFRPDLARRWGATFIGLGPYEWFKSVVRRRTDSA